MLHGSLKPSTPFSQFLNFLIRQSASVPPYLSVTRRRKMSTQLNGLLPTENGPRKLKILMLHGTAPHIPSSKYRRKLTILNRIHTIRPSLPCQNSRLRKGPAESLPTSSATRLKTQTSASRHSDSLSGRHRAYIPFWTPQSEHSRHPRLYSLWHRCRC